MTPERLFGLIKEYIETHEASDFLISLELFEKLINNGGFNYTVGLMCMLSSRKVKLIIDQEFSGYKLIDEKRICPRCKSAVKLDGTKEDFLSKPWHCPNCNELLIQ